MSNTTEKTPTQKKEEVKNLLKEMFWHLEDVENKDLTPKLVRTFLRQRALVTDEVLEEFALNVMDGNTLEFWLRVEKLCWFIFEARQAVS